MEKEKEANFGGVIYIFCRGGENRRTMSGKINKYVVLKADFNCKCLSVYFTKLGPMPPSGRRTQTGSSGQDTVWGAYILEKNHEKPTWNHEKP